MAGVPSTEFTKEVIRYEKCSLTGKFRLPALKCERGCSVIIGPIMSVLLFVKIRYSRWPFTGTPFLWMHIRQEIQRISSLSSKCQEILVSSIVVDRSMLIPIHFQQWINRWTNCDSIIPTTGRQIYRSSFYNLNWFVWSIIYSRLIRFQDNGRQS